MQSKKSGLLLKDLLQYVSKLNLNFPIRVFDAASKRQHQLVKIIFGGK
jgi:hypothetical protein